MQREAYMKGVIKQYQARSFQLLKRQCDQLAFCSNLASVDSNQKPLTTSIASRYTYYIHGRLKCIQWSANEILAGA